jgi:hypothetical protein
MSFDPVTVGIEIEILVFAVEVICPLNDTVGGIFGHVNVTLAPSDEGGIPHRVRRASEPAQLADGTVGKSCDVAVPRVTEGVAATVGAPDGLQRLGLGKGREGEEPEKKEEGTITVFHFGRALGLKTKKL